MKTIKIRKNNEFSDRSKVLLHNGSSLIHIKGFDPISFQVEPGEEIYVSQLWTQSNRIRYDKLKENSMLLIKPRLGRVLAFIILVVFTVCTVIFLFTKWRWSYIPLVPFLIYIGLYLSFFKNQYLIIKEEVKS